MTPIMFVSVKSTSNSPRISMQIVQSVRHIGIANSEQGLLHLKHLAEIIKTQMQEQTQP